MCGDSKAGMETYEVEHCVCGHDVCRRIWSLTFGEQLICKRELRNTQHAHMHATIGMHASGA